MEVFHTVSACMISLVVILCLAQTTYSQNDAQIPSNDNTSNSVITCCYVNSDCRGCRTVYSVNSIVYCCPDCMGEVLVTDLRCGCYASKDLDRSKVKCVLSDKVVGDYFPARPSYYSVDANIVKSSTLCLALAFVLAYLHTFMK